jgi:hypothetical protein
MSENHKKILIISYYAGIPGACQSEWLDDKIDSLIKGGNTVEVVSGPFAKLKIGNEIKHSRVASISFKDFNEERGYMTKFVGYVSRWYALMWPLVLTFGVISDLLSIAVTRGIGEGRWSWILSSVIPSLWRAMIFRPDVVLTTGGPASAHIVGILVSKITRCPVVLELQDPLSGDDIGRNPQARGWLYRVEKVLIAFADKIVYVTNDAANFAIREFGTEKISAVYPGATNFNIPKPEFKNDKLKLVHLGSLYASRNFTAIIDGIDSLITDGVLSESGVELINLGHVSPEIKAEICLKSYVRILSPVPREEALRYAAGCDIMLLIQNADDRSRVTIPYKTYDYLNLKNSTLALLNSAELTALILANGHIAVNLEDMQGIKSGIKQIMNSEFQARPKLPKIDPVIQALSLVRI